MKPQSAKSKGRSWQQAIAKYLTEALGLEEGDIVSRPMGSGGEDLIMSPAARRAFPVTIEAKNTKVSPGKKALEQAAYNCKKDTVPVMIWHAPRTTMDAGEGELRIKVKDFVKYTSLVREQERAKVVNEAG